MISGVLSKGSRGADEGGSYFWRLAERFVL